MASKRIDVLVILAAYDRIGEFGGLSIEEIEEQSETNSFLDRISLMMIFNFVTTYYIQKFSLIRENMSLSLAHELQLIPI